MRLPFVSRVIAKPWRAASRSRLRSFALAHAPALWVALALALTAPLASAQLQSLATFSGASDPAAAIALDDHRVLVADGPSATLLVYDAGKPGAPIQTIDLNDLMSMDPAASGLRLEGGALLNDYVYWIGTVGRDAQDAKNPANLRFFAAKLRSSQNPLDLAPCGRIVSKLAQWLAKDKRMKAIGLPAPPSTELNMNIYEPPPSDLANRPPLNGVPGLSLKRAAPAPAQAEKSTSQRVSAPKQAGAPQNAPVGNADLVIDALSASAEPTELWIGLRSPTPEVKGVPCAVAIPLENAGEIAMAGGKALWGTPLFWDFNGLGVRAMAWDPIARHYWVVAGPSHGGGGPFVLYRWSGGHDAKPEAVSREIKGLPADFTPDAILTFFGKSHSLLLLSSDGDVKVKANAGDCKPGKRSAGGVCRQSDLSNLAKRTFRGAWIDFF